MDLAALRKTCESRLRELDLPVPFDARSFCHTLAQRRGRRITLLPTDAQLGPCGLLVQASDVDYIFFEQQTSALHQEHIILHEVAHLVCGHAGPVAHHAELLRLLVPDLRQDVVHAMLARAGYAVAAEQEAELLASLILEHVAARAHQTRASPAADPVDQLDAVLGGTAEDREQR